MKTKRTDNMPKAAKQELEALAAALYDSLFSGSVEAAVGELLNQQSKLAWSGFNNGQPGAQQRYHQIERIRHRMLGFLTYCHLFLEDVELLTGSSQNKGVRDEQ